MGIRCVLWWKRDCTGSEEVVYCDGKSVCTRVGMGLYWGGKRVCTGV